MQIKGFDVVRNAPIILTAHFTNEHPASHYGQAVMVIDEWENQDVMSHENWILSGFEVMAFENAAEKIAFEEWFSLILKMAGTSTGFC